MSTARNARRFPNRKNRKEAAANIEKFTCQRDAYKAQKLDMMDSIGVDMGPFDRGIEHSDRMVQYWTRQLQELS